jgi:hypothetical protein
VQELALLSDDAKVYKLVGPVLVRQEVKEAQQTVDKRIDFIGGELCVARRRRRPMHCPFAVADSHAARTPSGLQKASGQDHRRHGDGPGEAAQRGTCASAQAPAGAKD